MDIIVRTRLIDVNAAGAHRFLRRCFENGCMILGNRFLRNYLGNYIHDLFSNFFHNFVFTDTNKFFD